MRVLTEDSAMYHRLAPVMTLEAVAWHSHVIQSRHCWKTFLLKPTYCSKAALYWLGGINHEGWHLVW